MTERQLKEQSEQLLAVAINSFTRAVRQMCQGANFPNNAVKV
jgi:hypothetical protein